MVPLSLSIFVSHSFDHSDKLLGVLRFIRSRGIRHVDHSIPAWDPYNGPDVQAEIERRIRRCHRVIVVLTKGIHRSPWIRAEVEWARRYRKPVIAVWPQGEAGEPIPEVVAESAPYLIGWRLTDALTAARHTRGRFVLAPALGGHYTEKWIQGLLLRLVERAGVRWLGTHALRRTCATRIADNGGGINAVAAQLRHRGLQMAARYIDRHAGAGEAALRALER